MRSPALPKEGDLYRIYTVDDCTFEIRYGFYEEKERYLVEPLPIFPDMVTAPVYTSDGVPVTAYVQAPCSYYNPCMPQQPEEWCGDCLHYDGGQKKMGRCLCPQRRKPYGP